MKFYQKKKKGGKGVIQKDIPNTNLKQTAILIRHYTHNSKC